MLDLNNILYTYILHGYGKCVLGDDEDIFWIVALVKQFCLEHFDVQVKQKENNYVVAFEVMN